MTKNGHKTDVPAAEDSYQQITSANAARSPLASKLSDKDRLLRHIGVESNSANPEASRNSANISIRFSKKAAEDSEEESEAVLAIKVPPPVVPESTDVELNEPV